MDAAKFTKLPLPILNDDQLSKGARLLVATINYCLWKGVQPTHAYLAAQVGCSHDTIARYIRELESTGVLEVIRHSGRGNEYRLSSTRISAGGTTRISAGGTTRISAGGTTRISAGGPASAPLLLIKTKREEEETPPPPHQPDLFEPQTRPWFLAKVDYYLHEAGLDDLRSWFPALVLDYFAARSWWKPSDPDTAMQWAKRLHAVADRRAIETAFAWAQAHPTKVFARPDHLQRIIDHILLQQRSPPAPKTTEPSEAMGLVATLKQLATKYGGTP